MRIYSRLLNYIDRLQGKMEIRRIIERLSYKHSRSAMRYVLREPSLFHAMSPIPTGAYFAGAVEAFQKLRITSCLHYLFSDRFLAHLEQNGFEDQEGIGILLFLLVRQLKPECVVETGVARGASSAYILNALHENSKGHLYSIDLPPYAAGVKLGSDHYLLNDGQLHTVSKEYSIGQLVPEYLKDRWSLILGDSRKELPIVLAAQPSVDMFLHDSLHTYEHMRFEYEAAWPHIRPGGILVSHDTLWNSAFYEFSRQVKAKPQIYYTLGLLRKQ